MSVTIHDLLGELRATALDERDKGDKFERLIRAYLLNEPEWTARFEHVWLWSQWPGRGGRHDTGIDLVAQRRDGEGLAAIQCKFYASDHKVSKADIDSFISASAKSEWTERYVFDTAAGWTGNAEETLEGVAQRIDIAFLDDARVDWSKYSWSKPDEVELAKAHQPRRHQTAAIDDVIAGLAEQDRGQLIMACGTGKTYTSLRIAEQMVGEGGTVLFLVPSIQLLSQSLREWMAQTAVDIRPFAVCSDVRVGRRTADDSGDLSTIDLTEPATTDPELLVARMQTGRWAKGRMTVIFSTYQSIDVISQAQLLGLHEFDLVICDEAHRTTGRTLAGEEESAFVKVHDERFISASKRLYMTATPRVFDDAVTKKAQEKDAVLADMGDLTMFGPELHRLGFGQAVEQSLLTDYKVIVLTIDEEYVAENFQTVLAEDGEIQLNDAAKLLGCWQGLAKNFGKAVDQSQADMSPMRRAVAFAKDIRSSKAASRAFPALVDRARLDESRDIKRHLDVEAVHVDGTMGIHERNTYLDWLKAEPSENTCRILTNARCLSEGVDVPALDAVMFLTPRGSQVDVVQSVGRVMRKDPAGVKQLGYIILPVVVPSNMTPAEALNDNKRYKVVWQVLQALRSHDDRFRAMINQIDLNKKKDGTILIVDPTPPRPGEGGAGEGGKSGGPADPHANPEQPSLDFGFETFRDAMYARIVKKVGERNYWDDWAQIVADIAQAHIARINGLLAAAGGTRDAFEAFLDGLRGILNESITADEAVEMLAQHLITRPIFEALFAGYDFVEHNPVSQTMERMLSVLDEHALEAENAPLEKFYASVRNNLSNIDNPQGRQTVLVELYNNFFAKAFKRRVERLGIVYTPLEIVDFILRSADEVLQKEFGQSLSDEGVHILDGFTGTGTFIVRLLQLGLIEPHDLARKYTNEIHANEILLLAYYIAAINIETTYADLVGEAAPFPGLVLTDTFQSYEDGDRDDLEVFPENNERIAKQRELPITVIVGNPPYSAGQDSANDDNANEKYEHLDKAIEDTYAATSAAVSKRTLYDSYIRAIKWASLRLNGRGIVAFVLNNGFIKSNSADGVRRSLGAEFSSIHIVDLRGSALGSGEPRKREGGGVFGEGSRAGAAVLLLVRNETKLSGIAKVHYTDIGDYLKSTEKLARLRSIGTVAAAPQIEIAPNDDGDWLGQRDSAFGNFLPIGEKGTSRGIFDRYCLGMASGRDAWIYNFSAMERDANVTRMIENYNAEVDAASVQHGYAPTRDETKISWNRNLEKDFSRRRRLSFERTARRVSTYRPFLKSHSYLHRDMNAMLYQTLRFFPTPDTPNVGIVVATPRENGGGSSLMTSSLPDQVVFSPNPTQFFARWSYEPLEETAVLDILDDDVIDGHRRIDNISHEALRDFQSAYPSESVTKDDIFFYVYGLLHSPTYRHRFAHDLTKMLPRIPFAQDFWGYAEAGRALSELHLNYESATPYPLEGLNAQPPSGVDPYDFFAVGDKKMRFGKPTAEQKADGLKADVSTLIYSDRIVLSGIPEEAYRYALGSRSAIEWIVDRYYVKTDKPSGIVNDPNDWSRGVGDPRYIIDLLARIVTVSLETMKIIDALPPLQIIEAAGEG